MRGLQGGELPQVNQSYVSSTETQTHTAESTRRLVSLDVLRGGTVAFMILVNNAGDGSASYAQLHHSAWNGCTLTDLVFPMFLFIMGVSMTISFTRRLAKRIPRWEIAQQILRRSFIIFCIGLFINAFPMFRLDTLRYGGVMQRIGVCYLLAGIVLLALGRWGVVALTCVGVFGYWAVMTYLPVPGFGVPGVAIPVLDPHGNLASYIDRLVIPQAHRYHFSFYDPEGILSTLPATATTCLGILAGSFLHTNRIAVYRKLLWMSAAAIVLISSGLLWSEAFPLNKRLWTSSYVLFTAGISIGLMVLFQWLIDVRGFRSRFWEPFLAFGANALTAYVFSELLGATVGSISFFRLGTFQRFTFQLVPTACGSTAFRSLLWSLAFVFICWIPVAYLRKRGMIVKL